MRHAAYYLASVFLTVTISFSLSAFQASAATPGVNGRIAYLKGYGPGNSRSAVFTANVDGSDQSQLISSAIVYGFKWSPDGNYILASRQPTDGLDKYALAGSKTIIDAYTVWQTRSARQATPTERPVYRFANFITKERLPSLDIKERTEINGVGGWVYEGIAFYMPN